MGAGIFGHTPFAILLGIFPSQNTVFDLGQSRNLVKLVFNNHTIQNKPHNIQIRPKNRTKPVGHYTAPRRKITRVGGNLPLVAQFRVLRHPGLLTARHSLLFLFLFPLFLFFFLLFSSFHFFSFPPFLLSIPPFLFSFPPFLFPFLLLLLCKTRENSNFLKKGKIVILVKTRNFSRSWMMKHISLLESSCEI